VGKLLQLLNKPADPHKVIAKAIAESHSAQIDGMVSTAVAAMADHLRLMAESIADALGDEVKREVAAQMPEIPAPQITRVTETPIQQITQVIEKPTERIVEKLLTDTLTVHRDKKGRISRVVRGSHTFIVNRDSDGLITTVVPK
jgi:hypothetical protein